MFTKSCLFGDTLFMFTFDNSQLISQTTPSQLIKNYKIESVRQKDVMERELIMGVRLADFQGNFDTLSISEDTVELPERFFQFLQIVSDEQCARSPCAILKNKNYNYYTWEFPAWFDYSQYNSLGSWIGSIYERLLWLRYGLYLTEMKIKPLAGPFNDLPELINYLKGINKEERKNIELEFSKNRKAENNNDNEALLDFICAKNTLQKSSDSELIKYLLFIPLVDMPQHDIRQLLLLTIKNSKSKKCQHEILMEENKKQNHEVDIFQEEKIGLLSGKPVSKYDFLFKNKPHKKKKAKKSKPKPEELEISKIEHVPEIKQDITWPEELEIVKIELIPEKKEFVPEKKEDTTEPEEPEIVKIEHIPEKKEDITEPEEFALDMTNKIVVGIINKIGEEEEKQLIEKNIIIPEDKQNIEKNIIIPEEKHNIETNITMPEEKPPPKKKKSNKKNKNKNKKKPQAQPIEGEKIEIKREELTSPNSEGQKETDCEQEIDKATFEKNSYLINSSSEQEINVSKSIFSKITESIQARQKRIDLYNRKRKEQRQNLISKISETIKKVFTEQEIFIEVFGSFETELALETSDIDLGIHGLSMNYQEEISESLAIIEKKLKEARFITSVMSITTASVPVVKLVNLIIIKGG